jgi:hypothetical protein
VVQRRARAEAALLEPAHQRGRGHAVALRETRRQPLHAPRRDIATAIDEYVVAQGAPLPAEPYARSMTITRVPPTSSVSSAGSEP